MIRKKLLLFAIPLIIGFAYFSYKYAFINKTVIHPEISEITEAVYGLGTISAAKVFHLKIGVMSMINKIHVEEGQSVKKGDPLVNFDTLPEIKSPISGTVTSITYKVNEIAFPQTNVLTVIDMSEKYIILSMEEQSVIKVRQGQKARIVLEAIKDKSFIGEVKSIYPTDNQFFVKITSKDIPLEALPGMTADIAIEIYTKHNATTLPLRAIKENKIKLKRNNNFIETKIKPGLKTNEKIEILEPALTLEDEILVE